MITAFRQMRAEGRQPRPLRALSDFVRRLTVTDTTLAEFGSSIAFLAMAVLMLDPWRTLDAVGVNIPIFRMMLAIASEHGWGFVFLAIGSFQSYANLADGLSLRKAAAFVSATAWGLLAIMGGTTHPPSFFLAVCGAKCLVQSIVYLRLGILKACDDCERSGG